MPGLLDLPPELIVNILVDAGTNDSCRDLHALSVSSKWVHDCFKENEHLIFSRLVKRLIPKGPGLYDLVVKVGYLQLTRSTWLVKDPESGKITLASWENLAASIRGTIKADLHEDLHIRELQHLYGGILSWLRNGPQELFEMGCSANFIHPYRLPPPRFVWRLPQEMRSKAYHGALFVQLYNHMRSSKPSTTRTGPRGMRITDRTGHNIFQHFMKGFPSCYTPRPAGTQYYLEGSDYGNRGWRTCLEIFSPGLNPNLET